MAVATIKMYINDRQRLKELYAYGESLAAKNNFTEEDVYEEIRKYRKIKIVKPKEYLDMV